MSRFVRRLIDSAPFWGSALIILFPLLFLDCTTTPVFNWVGMVPTGAFDPRANSEHLMPMYTYDPVGTLALIPNEVLTLRALLHGVIPFWNPFQGLGQLLAAEMQMGVFYPLGFLRYFIPLSHYDLYSIVHWFLTGLFLCLLGKRLGLERVYAAFSGVAVFSVGFLQEFLPLASVICVVTWVPFLWLAVEHAFRSPGKIGPRLAIAFGTFCLGTAGHMPPTMYATAAVAIYFAVRANEFRRGVALLPFFLIGILLAAPQWLVFLHHATINGGQFRNWRTEFFSLWRIPAIVFPYIFGPYLDSAVLGSPNPEYSRGYWAIGWLPSATAFFSLAGLFALLKKRDTHLFASLAVFVCLAGWAFGVPPFSLISRLPSLGRLMPTYVMFGPYLVMCLFAGFGLRELCADDATLKQTLLSWAALCVGALCLFLVVCFVAGGIKTAPQRSVILTGGVCGLLWALAVPTTIYFVRRVCGRGGILIAAFGGVIFASVGYFPRGVTADLTLSGRLDALLAYLFLALVLVALKKSSRKAWVLVPMFGLPLAITVFRIHPGLPHRANLMHRAPYTLSLPEGGNPWRVFGTGGYFSGNISTPFHTSAVNNQAALVPETGNAFVQNYFDECEDSNTFLGIGAGRISGDAAKPSARFQSKRRFWDYLAVRYIVGPRDSFAGIKDLRRVTQDGSSGADVWENLAAKPRAYVAPDSVAVGSWQEAQEAFAKQGDLRRTAYVEHARDGCAGDSAYPGETTTADVVELSVDLNRAKAIVDAKTRGTLVLADLYNPGWSATVDGKPSRVFQVNGVFRGVCVSAGRHEVVWSYRPPLFAASLAMATVGFLLLGIAIVMR